MLKIFVINIGRSGSKSISAFLGIHHEPSRILPTSKEQPKIWEQLEGRIALCDKPFYGEANNAWRYRLDELMKRHPDALYIHLIRNPRDVISSYQNRAYYKYTPTATLGHNLPLPIENWDKLKRFEKLCHFWVYWNDYISQRVPTLVRMEDIQHILPLQNVGVPHKSWEDWQEESFIRICGEAKKKYGY